MLAHLRSVTFQLERAGVVEVCKGGFQSHITLKFSIKSRITLQILGPLRVMQKPFAILVFVNRKLM